MYLVPKQKPNFFLNIGNRHSITKINYANINSVYILIILLNFVFKIQACKNLEICLHKGIIYRDRMKSGQEEKWLDAQ